MIWAQGTKGRGKEKLLQMPNGGAGGAGGWGEGNVLSSQGTCNSSPVPPNHEWAQPTHRQGSWWSATHICICSLSHLYPQHLMILVSAHKSGLGASFCQCSQRSTECLKLGWLIAQLQGLPRKLQGATAAPPPTSATLLEEGGYDFVDKEKRS